MNLTDQTPQQIDEQLAANYAEQAAAAHRIANLRRTQAEAAKRGNEAKVDEKAQQIEQVQQQQVQLLAAAAPFEAEHEERRWARFYLVNNTNGHVHSTTRCSTCTSRTQFTWLTEHSGDNVQAFVQLAGERACTVCFPDAPVEKKSLLRVDVDARQAAQQREDAKQAKEVEAAARLAKQGGALSEPVELSYREFAKTVQQAKTAAVNCLVDYMFRRYSKNNQMKRENLVLLRTLRAALIEAGQDWDAVRAELEKKAGAKYRKQMREAQAFARQMGMPLED